MNFTRPTRKALGAIKLILLEGSAKIAGRKVKAGQRIRRGQVLGVVGMTGRTSGPHVHWEVSRDFRTLDPTRAGR